MTEKHKLILMEILKKYPYTFYAYGSRTKGTHRPTSDLDICFMDSIPFAVQAHIEEDFEESDLPFRVDLSDFNLMSQEFQQHIKDDLVLLQETK
jgi:predicted nucleotidyltransferase